MPIDLSSLYLREGQTLQASHFNDLTAAVQAFLSGIAADPDLAQPLTLSRSRQHLDGARHYIHSFKRWLGLSTTSNVAVRDATAFGAVGDGVSSDEDNINNAIDEIPNTGGIVILPPGTYGCDNPIELKFSAARTNVVLLGFGPSTVLKLIGDSDWVVDFHEGGSIGAQATGISLVNLTIDGSKDSYDCIAGIRAYEAVDCLIQNVTIKNCSGHGILLGEDPDGSDDGTSGIRIKNCRIHDNTQNGIEVRVDNGQGYTSNLSISDCSIHDNGLNGVNLSSALSWSRVSGCRCFNNGGSGIATNDLVSNDALRNRMMIEDNVCHGNGANGIQVGQNNTDANCVSIHDNVCFDNGVDGIRLTGTGDPEGLAVSNNVCYGNGQGGIRLAGGLIDPQYIPQAWTGFESGVGEFRAEQWSPLGADVGQADPKHGLSHLRIFGSTTHYFRLRRTSAPQGRLAPSGITGKQYISFYFQPVILPASDDEVFFAIRTGSAAKFEFRITSGGLLRAYGDPSTTPVLHETGSTALSTGTWYRIDISYEDLDGTNSEYELLLNGTSELSGTGNTGQIGPVLIMSFGKDVDRNGNNVEFYYDDAVWATGAFTKNDHSVQTLVPNEDVFDSNPNSGSSTEATFYEALDELISTGAEYMYYHPVGGGQQAYDFMIMNVEGSESLSLSDKLILGVKVHWRAEGGTFVELGLGAMIDDGTVTKKGIGSSTTSTADETVEAFALHLAKAVHPTEGPWWTTDLIDKLQFWIHYNQLSAFEDYLIEQMIAHVLVGEYGPVGEATNLLYKDNVCFNNGTVGIGYETEGSDIKTDTIIHGNVCVDTGQEPDQNDGIAISALTQDFSVVGNICVGNVDEPIDDDGVGTDKSHNQESD